MCTFIFLSVAMKKDYGVLSEVVLVAALIGGMIGSATVSSKVYRNVLAAGAALAGVALFSRNRSKNGMIRSLEGDVHRANRELSRQRRQSDVLEARVRQVETEQSGISGRLQRHGHSIGELLTESDVMKIGLVDDASETTPERYSDPQRDRVEHVGLPLGVVTLYHPDVATRVQGIVMGERYILTTYEAAAGKVTQACGIDDEGQSKESTLKPLVLEERSNVAIFVVDEVRYESFMNRWANTDQIKQVQQVEIARSGPDQVRYVRGEVTDVKYGRHAYIATDLRILAHERGAPVLTVENEERVFSGFVRGNHAIQEKSIFYGAQQWRESAIRLLERDPELRKNHYTLVSLLKQQQNHLKAA